MFFHVVFGLLLELPAHCRMQWLHFVACRYPTTVLSVALLSWTTEPDLACLRGRGGGGAF
eukprot:6183337-Pleurochrysis_carterae.AAC.2